MTTEISEKEVQALAEVLLGRVNAPEQEIYRAARDGLEAAARVRAEDNAREQVPSGWQPIETAPKDGDTPVLLWGRYWSDSQGYFPRPLQGYWSERNQRWEATGQPYHGFAFGVRPSHWMPLPTPPTAGGDDE